jgi:AbiJ N-terminal domain 3/Abortive infection C-terminus
MAMGRSFIVTHAHEAGTEPVNTITEVTRRAIIDYLSVGRHWSGALQEDDFLGRIYDLKRMPSTDYRAEFNTAAKDIWKHRIMNSDWPDDWIFTDERFDLLFGPDEAFLKFLAETVHPIVRPDTEDVLAMVAEYNSALNVDGWEIQPVKKISNKPVFSYRQSLGTPHQLEEAKRVADRLTGPYIAQQVRRLQEAADADAELAIGTAKEFLESICKTILAERGIPAGRNDDLPGIVRATVKSVEIVPPELSSQPQLEKTLTVLLNNLGSIGNQLAELRNQYGTGHGRSTDHVGLPARHAKLAIGAAATLAVFLYESHEAKLPGL